MILVILTIAAVLAVVCVSMRTAPWFLRMVPVVVYPFYRFSGSLAFLSGLGAALCLPRVNSSTPQGMLLFLIAGVFFLALAFAKLTVLILKSPDMRWWMIVQKLNFGLAAVICLPLGLLAWACYWWFEVRRVHGQNERQLTTDRWAKWQLSGNGPGRSDVPSHATALVPRGRSRME